MATKKKQMDNTRKLPFSALHEIALKEARKIHREKVEHAAVIDEMGNVTRVVGNGDEVCIPSHILKTAKIIIHNHPHEFKEPMTFSAEDIYNLFRHNLDEIVVCGYGCYFYMRKEACVMLAKDVLIDVRRIYREVEKIQFKRHFGEHNTDPKTARSEYRSYRCDILRECHRRLLAYATEKKLSYKKEKL